MEILNERQLKPNEKIWVHLTIPFTTCFFFFFVSNSRLVVIFPYKNFKICVDCGHRPDPSPPHKWPRGCWTTRSKILTEISLIFFLIFYGFTPNPIHYDHSEQFHHMLLILSKDVYRNYSSMISRIRSGILHVISRNIALITESSRVPFKKRKKENNFRTQHKYNFIFIRKSTMTSLKICPNI